MIGPDHARRDRCIDRLAGYTQQSGRDPASIGIDAIVTLTRGHPVPDPDTSLRGPEEWAADVAQWQALGATRLSINTMGAGFATADDHIHALHRFLEITPTQHTQPADNTLPKQ